MNTFDWVVSGIAFVIVGGYLFLRFIFSGKDSMR